MTTTDLTFRRVTIPFTLSSYLAVAMPRCKSHKERPVGLVIKRSPSSQWCAYDYTGTHPDTGQPCCGNLIGHYPRRVHAESALADHLRYTGDLRV